MRETDPPPGSAPAPINLQAFRTARASGSVPTELFRDTVREARDDLERRFQAGTPATELVRHRARVVDWLLAEAWQECFTATESFTLVAVGGYGRGELHPRSDIDVMILVPDGATLPQQAIEAFVTLLWDMGLEVGHSCRSLAECVAEAERDITVATNLMEARRVTGSATLFEAMQAATAADRVWPSRDFFEAKRQEQLARHHKYHDTAYNLEPNVKEGPGGLRDIQMIAWVAKRHFGAETFRDLVRHSFLTEQEHTALAEAQAFLWQVRFALHTVTGRREERLLFDYQHILAERFGYRDGGPNLAVEQFMKRYYRTVMEVSRLNEMLLQLFQEAILYADKPGTPTPINKRFQARNDFIEVTDQAVFARYPFALLEIFLLLQQHPELNGVRASTIRLLRDHRHLIDSAFRDDLRNRTLFMEILRARQGVTEQLRRMNRYGVLAAYLPAFGDIVGLMQYDLFHVYTVDEHIITVIRNLRRFAVPEHSQEFPLCSQIMQTEIPKPELLYLAALFHDIAKGHGGDHSKLGAAEAMAFCLHHGLSQFDARLVAWLVHNHLIMSTTAQRKDISDPEVLNEFAAHVRDQMHLNYLYLLTIADIRGTNPRLWNSWRDALLVELYTGTKRALRRGLENPIDKPERIREVQGQARALLHTHGASDAKIDSVWQQLDDDYFLRHHPDEIAWHTQAIVQRSEELPLVLVRHQTHRGGTEIFIYTRIDDRLFARTTQALDQMGLTVLDARIISSRDGYALDTYIVLESSGEPLGSPHRVQEILTTLATRLRDPGVELPPVSRRSPRQFKHFPTTTEVTFSTDEGNQRTVMELIAADRPGLLSRVGQAFVDCGVRLENAKIATFGARVEDVFFITDHHNVPLQGETQPQCLRRAITHYLDEDTHE